MKAAESLFHSLLSSLHVLTLSTDVIYFLDPANAPFCLLLRLFGRRVVVHTDGLGWKRRKWGRVARSYYKWVEWLSARAASALVTDNPVMQDYYTAEYGTRSMYIPYGASNDAGVDERVYGEFSLTPGSYLLVVARLERENNVDLIIEEYVTSRTGTPLVVVGDAPYDAPYFAHLKDLADERVQFTGRVNDQARLNALYGGARLYIHGHEVGGTNPSLLRAMYMGTAPVVMDAPFNTSVVSDCGFVFSRTKGSLRAVLEHLEEHPALVEEKAEKARLRAATAFRWETVAEKHAELFRSVAGA